MKVETYYDPTMKVLELTIQAEGSIERALLNALQVAGSKPELIKPDDVTFIYPYIKMALKVKR